MALVGLSHHHVGVLPTLPTFFSWGCVVDNVSVVVGQDLSVWLNLEASSRLSLLPQQADQAFHSESWSLCGGL